MKRLKSSEIAKENRREEGEDREGDRREIKKGENGEWKRKRRNQDVNL